MPDTLPEDQMKREINKLFEQVFRENEGLEQLKNETDDFFNKLKNDKGNFDLFFRSVRFYNYYAIPILEIKDEYEHRVTNMLLIILFSLVEGIMQDVEYKDFATFLKEKAQSTADSEEVNKKVFLEELEEEYRRLHGSIKKVKKFFIDYVSEADQCHILEKNENGKYDNFNKVLGDIYSMRSKFVHELGLDKLFPVDALPPVEVQDESGDMPLELQKTLNITDFTIIIWVGILKKFGFDEKKLNVL